MGQERKLAKTACHWHGYSFSRRLYRVKIDDAMRRTRFFMIVALLALCAATTAAQEPSPEERLAAEAKWSANKPKAYEFTFWLIACCVIPLSGPDVEPILFRVVNGIGSLTSSWVARAEASQGSEKYSTVEKQFAFIGAELAKRPYRVEIEF